MLFRSFFCVIGAILGGGDSRVQALASAYGQAVELAFQITDDILDMVGDEAQLGKPVGSDEAQGKSTYPALLGIERSRALARESVDQAMAALSGFSHLALPDRPARAPLDNSQAGQYTPSRSNRYCVHLPNPHRMVGRLSASLIEDRKSVV